MGGIGAKMLAKMGWSEGTGLGAKRDGMVVPLQVSKRPEKLGIGAERRPFRNAWWETAMEDAYGKPRGGAPAGAAGDALFEACEGRRCRPHGSAKLARIDAHDKAANAADTGEKGDTVFSVGEDTAKNRKVKKSKKKRSAKDKETRRKEKMRKHLTSSLSEKSTDVTDSVGSRKTKTKLNGIEKKRKSKEERRQRRIGGSSKKSKSSSSKTLRKKRRKGDCGLEQAIVEQE